MKKTLLKQLIKEQIRQVLKENSLFGRYNNIMIDGKQVDIESLQSEPSTSTSDAYIDSAKFTDGTELNWKQLEKLQTEYPNIVGFASHGLR